MVRSQRLWGAGLIAALVGVAFAPRGQASLIRTEQDATVACSGSDLLQTHLSGTPSLSGAWTGEGASGAPAALYDGIAAYAGGSIAPRYKVEKAAYGAPSTNATVTFTLDTIANTQGYDITQIDFYHGWGDDGRDGFEFKIEFATISNPSFQVYGTTAGKYDPPANYGRSRITDTLGILASGVSQIRITPTQIDAGMGGLSEIDVFGAPVPEPTAIALLAMGLLSLSTRRR